MSTLIYNFLLQNGLEIVNAPEQSDIIILSTCGFDQDREELSKSLVLEYIERFSTTKQLIICGCLPKIASDLFDLPNVITIGPTELYKFDCFFEPSINIAEISASMLHESFIDRDYGMLDQYYIQICQGCINNCSYCAIRKAKGYVSSKPMEWILSQIHHATKLGAKTIRLLADDCGSYGVDLGIDFADLLNEISEYDIFISVNYIEPNRLITLYPKIRQQALNKLQFLNIPVQSTSNRIIDLMNRRYDIAVVLDLAREIRARVSDIFLETHIIYGFPSETRDEFEDTFRVLDYFDSAIYFYYTDRPNVESCRFHGKISRSEIIRRTESILTHPRLCLRKSSSELPAILLGYDLHTPNDIYKSIARSYPDHRPEK